MPSFATRRVEQAPDEVALTDSERSYGWAEVGAILDRAANALQALDLGEARRVGETR